MAKKKLKDFFITDVFGSAGFEANEIEFLNAASDITEVEISDELQEKYHRNMLSRDAAMNDVDISKKYRTNLWGEFTTLMDTRIKKILPLLTEEQQITIKEIKGTPDKMDKLVEYLNAKTPDKDDSEIKKEFEVFKTKSSKSQSDYELQISGLKESHVTELTEKDKRFKNFQIDSIIKGEIFSENLIDKIPGGKIFLADSKIKELRENPEFIMNLNESGLVELYQRNDPSKKYFVNNKPVILKQVLDPLMKDWRKNSPGPSKETLQLGQESTPSRALTFREIQAEKSKANLVEAAANLG